MCDSVAAVGVDEGVIAVGGILLVCGEAPSTGSSMKRSSLPIGRLNPSWDDSDASHRRSRAVKLQLNSIQPEVQSIPAQAYYWINSRKIIVALVQSVETS